MLDSDSNNNNNNKYMIDESFVVSTSGSRWRNLARLGGCGGCVLGSGRVTVAKRQNHISKGSKSGGSVVTGSSESKSSLGETVILAPVSSNVNTIEDSSYQASNERTKNCTNDCKGESISTATFINVCIKDQSSSLPSSPRKSDLLSSAQEDNLLNQMKEQTVQLRKTTLCSSDGEDYGFEDRRLRNAIRRNRPKSYDFSFIVPPTDNLVTGVPALERCGSSDDVLASYNDCVTNRRSRTKDSSKRGKLRLLSKCIFASQDTPHISRKSRDRNLYQNENKPHIAQSFRTRSFSDTCLDSTDADQNLMDLKKTSPPLGTSTPVVHCSNSKGHSQVNLVLHENDKRNKRTISQPVHNNAVCPDLLASHNCHKDTSHRKNHRPYYFTPKIIKQNCSTASNSPSIDRTCRNAVDPSLRASPFITIDVVPKREAIVIPFNTTETTKESRNVPPPKPPRLSTTGGEAAVATARPLLCRSTAEKANKEQLTGEFLKQTNVVATENVLNDQPLETVREMKHIENGFYTNCSTVYSNCYNSGPISHAFEKALPATVGSAIFVGVGPSSLPLEISEKEDFKLKAQSVKSARIKERPSVSNIFPRQVNSIDLCNVNYGKMANNLALRTAHRLSKRGVKIKRRASFKKSVTSKQVAPDNDIGHAVASNICNVPEINSLGNFPINEKYGNHPSAWKTCPSIPISSENYIEKSQINLQTQPIFFNEDFPLVHQTTKVLRRKSKSSFRRMLTQKTGIEMRPKIIKTCHLPENFNIKSSRRVELGIKERAEEYNDKIREAVVQTQKCRQLENFLVATRVNVAPDNECGASTRHNMPDIPLPPRRPCLRTDSKVFKDAMRSYCREMSASQKRDTVQMIDFQKHSIGNKLGYNFHKNPQPLFPRNNVSLTSSGNNQVGSNLSEQVNQVYPAASLVQSHPLCVHRDPKPNQPQSSSLPSPSVPTSLSALTPSISLSPSTVTPSSALLSPSRSFTPMRSSDGNVLHKPRLAVSSKHTELVVLPGTPTVVVTSPTAAPAVTSTSADTKCYRNHHPHTATGGFYYRNSGGGDGGKDANSKKKLLSKCIDGGGRASASDGDEDFSGMGKRVGDGVRRNRVIGNNDKDACAVRGGKRGCFINGGSYNNSGTLEEVSGSSACLINSTVAATNSSEVFSKASVQRSQRVADLSKLFPQSDNDTQCSNDSGGAGQLGLGAQCAVTQEVETQFSREALESFRRFVAKQTCNAKEWKIYDKRNLDNRDCNSGKDCYPGENKNMLGKPKIYFDDDLNINRESNKVANSNHNIHSNLATKNIVYADFDIGSRDGIRLYSTVSESSPKSSVSKIRQIPLSSKPSSSEQPSVPPGNWNNFIPAKGSHNESLADGRYGKQYCARKARGEKEKNEFNYHAGLLNDTNAINGSCYAEDGICDRKIRSQFLTANVSDSEIVIDSHNEDIFASPSVPRGVILNDNVNGENTVVQQASHNLGTVGETESNTNTEVLSHEFDGSNSEHGYNSASDSERVVQDVRQYRGCDVTSTGGGPSISILNEVPNNVTKDGLRVHDVANEDHREEDASR